MALCVIERQQKETWYELHGELKANELFPALLPNSQSNKKPEDDIRTESDFEPGRYDGQKCPDAEARGDVEAKIDQFNKLAMAEFHDEALAAAKAKLTALNPGETLLQRDFLEEGDYDVLEEAAKELGISIPWDPAEAAQIEAKWAAEETARFQREKEQREQLAAFCSALPEPLQKVAELLKTGNSHSAVRAMFPDLEGKISGLVGELRKRGVQI